MSLDSIIATDDDPRRPVAEPKKKRDGLDHLIKGFMVSRGFTRSNAQPGHWVSRHQELAPVTFRHKRLRAWCEKLWPSTADCLAKLRGQVDARVRSAVE